MPRYTVAHAYRAVDNGLVLGPWVEGDVVVLDPDRAAWVNRDSPGTLLQPEPEEEPARPHPPGRPAGDAATRPHRRPAADREAKGRRAADTGEGTGEGTGGGS